MKTSKTSFINVYFPTFLFLLLSFSLMSFQNIEAIQPVEIELSSCPIASFSTQNNGCKGPCGITFLNESIDATSYHWDFGDGNSSSATNPTHLYENPGSYVVTLRAIGANCQHEFVGTVDVIQG
jgi:PKD repeat protein